MAWQLCPVCGKEREAAEKARGTILKPHNRWDGKKMIYCGGSGHPPVLARRKA